MQAFGGSEWRIQKPLVEKDVLLRGPLAASWLLRISTRICYNTGNNSLDWRRAVFHTALPCGLFEACVLGQASPGERKSKDLNGTSHLRGKAAIRDRHLGGQWAESDRKSFSLGPYY